MSHLQKLDPNNIPHLLEELEKYLPDSIVVYYSIINHIKWCENDADLNFTILCPNGDWRGGTLIAIADGRAIPDQVYGTIYALEENLEVLRNGLLKTDLIDWKGPLRFSSVPKRCVPAVRSVLSAKGYTDSSNYSEVCQLNYLPVDNIKNCSMPRCTENLRVGSLSSDNLQTVCDNWKYYRPEFRPVVAKMIELNKTSGVFLSHPETGGETLVAMVLQTEYGGIGLMSTLPGYRRKGYATLALAHLIQELGQNGITPFSLNVTDNQVSSSFFAKFGFKKGDMYQWVKPVKVVK